MRRRAHPVRRRQGRHHLRSDADVAARARGATRRYIAEIIDAIGPEKDVPAPDVNTNDQVMAWVMDTYSMHVGHTTTAVVTGKPLELGGSLGRREATGRGVMIVTREAAKHVGFDIKGATVAVQGFGNVGSVSAELLAEPGAKIVAVTDWKGGVYNANGLDVPKLRAVRAGTRRSPDFPGGEPLDQRAAVRARRRRAASRPRSRTRSPWTTRPRSARKIIVEGANGPTTPDAHAHLHERGVFVVPDILANSGGVTALVLRVGAGPPRLLLDRKGSERAARGEDVRGLRRRAADVAEYKASHCAPPPTSSPSTASRRSLA